MIVRPISIRQPQLGKLLSGELTSLRRPLSAITQRLGPGDVLWVREPFALVKKWDGLSPTAAARLGATPIFTRGCGQPLHGLLDAGRLRFARELLRVWHRYHLKIAQVERQQLQSITQAELAAEGFKTRAAFIAAWNLGLAVSSAKGNAWDENPLVAVIHFTAVAGPLPESAA